MASLLKVDTLQDTSGGALTFGKILQVKQTYNTDYISQSFSTNVQTNMTNMNVTITPSSTSSKILVQAQWFGEMSSQDRVYNTMFGFKRGSTVIGQPTNTGSSVGAAVGIQQALISYHASDAASTGESLWMQYLDSPATTSATTYHTWHASNANVTLKSGGTYSWTTSRTTGYERGTYSMTVWEIAG